MTDHKLTPDQEARFCEEFDICDNPDHGFIGAMRGIDSTDVGRLGCPTCDMIPDKEITVKPSQIKQFLAQEIQRAVEAERLRFTKAVMEVANDFQDKSPRIDQSAYDFRDTVLQALTPKTETKEDCAHK